MGLASDIKGGKYQKAITYINQLSHEKREQLIERINTPDRKGYTLLHHLMRAKNPSPVLVDLLCSLGADLNVTTKKNKTSLDLIVESSPVKKKPNELLFLDEATLTKAVMFLSKGVAIDPKHTRILIHSAIQLDSSENLKTLLELPKINVNARYPGIKLPFFRALEKPSPNPEIIQLLLDHNVLLADTFNNPGNLPKFEGQILEMMAAKSRGTLQKLRDNRKDTAVAYIDTSDNSHHTLKTFLRANTLCEESDKDKAKINVNNAFMSLLNYRDDYFIQLLMSAITLATLDGLTFYVANAPSIFPLRAENNFREVEGYFMEKGNQILLSALIDEEDLMLTIAHEGLHAILTKVPKELAHMCKPYAHKDKVGKNEYIEAVEETRRLVQETTLPLTSEGRRFVTKSLFVQVDSPNSPYTNQSQRLQEYVARAVEARVYSLRHPSAAKDIQALASPLFDYLDNNITKILEHYVREHPKLKQLVLPEIVAEKLQVTPPEIVIEKVQITPPKPVIKRALPTPPKPVIEQSLTRSKPLHSEKFKEELEGILSKAALRGSPPISTVLTNREKDNPQSFVGKISNNSRQTDSKPSGRVQVL